MNRPWMPLYVGDYLGDTGHLTTTQHGAYLLLMMQYWRKGGLPDDDKQLSKITKLPLKIWTEYRGTIQDFFYEQEGDPWRHRRIDFEINQTETIKQKRVLAGQKGGFWSAIAAQKKRGGASLSKHVQSQANAYQLDTKAAAGLEYSQSQSTSLKSAAPVENPKGHAGGRVEKAPLQASAELVESMKRKGAIL